MKGRVLIIAGSDSGGGAGIQADLKTVTALGGYAATAITALTAQDTTGVHAIEGVDLAFIARQIELSLGDIGADAIKTGMLHNAEVIETVVDALERHGPLIPVVVDPVMVAKGGSSLLDIAAVDVLKRRLLPRAGLCARSDQDRARLGPRSRTFEPRPYGPPVQGVTAAQPRKSAKFSPSCDGKAWLGRLSWSGSVACRRGKRSASMREFRPSGPRFFDRRGSGGCERRNIRCVNFWSRFR